MKHRFRNIIAFALALALALAFPAAAQAGSVSVTAEPLSVSKGDRVTVTVTVTGEHIAVADGVFTYDPALLAYVSGEGGASDGILSLVSAQQGGSSSLTAVLRFTARGAGDAEVRVTIGSVLSYGGEALPGGEAGVSISIAGSDAPGVSPSPAAVDLSLTGVEAENVEGAAETMYVWRSLGNRTLPSGYADRQVTYRGEYVGGAAVPDSEEPILLYLSNREGNNGGYYVYDEARGVLFPYVTMLSVSSTYTLLWPDETVEAPAGYIATTLLWKEREVPAWMPEGGDGSVYLVYARNSSGERGLFLYSVADESVQRYVAPPQAEPEPEATPQPEATPPPEPENEGFLAAFMANPIVFFAMCGACALFLALAILFAALYIRAGRDKRRAARMAKRLKKTSQDKDADASV